MKRAALAALALPIAVLSPAADAARAPGRMMVTAREFTFVSSRQVLPAGTSYVQLANQGEDSHDLAVRRLNKRGKPTGRTTLFPETRPGEVTTKKLRLKPGRYQLWCTLEGHRAAGMTAKLRVR